MPGFVPNEGEKLFADLFSKEASADRGTGMQLALFTNTGITEAITAATLTEPTGGGYARIELTAANWTNTTDAGTGSTTGCLAAYPTQTFTPSAGGYTGAVQGYAVISKGTTPRIMFIEVDPNAPISLTASTAYVIGLNVSIQ